MTEIIVGWDGDNFIPLQRYRKACDAEFVIGQRYIIAPGWPQSAAKRAMFHATLRQIYASIPDETSERWLSYDHFRYWLTIKCGFATAQEEVCASKNEAERAALMARKLSPYSLIERRENIVTIWTARSTKAHLMDGREFSALVDAVLAKAGDLIGVAPKALLDLNRARRDKPDKYLDRQSVDQPPNSPSGAPSAPEPRGALAPAEAGSVSSPDPADIPASERPHSAPEAQGESATLISPRPEAASSPASGKRLI